MKSNQVLHQSALVYTCCALLTSLLANDPVQAQLEQRRPRPNPANAVLKVQNLPPELVKILQNWEKESGKIQKLEGTHTRVRYDDIFQVEKHSDGKFYYEKPDKGAIVITGKEIPKGAQGAKRNANGKPYQLKPDQNERWICDGDRIFSINEDEKSYEVFPIPLQARGENIMEGPLPFLFGMPAKAAEKRYFLKLLVNTPNRIIIAVKPRRKSDAANYSEAKIILDPNTYFPSAVQLIHPGGKQSTVYQFKNVVANKNRGFIAVWFGKDPFRPDLDKYRLVGKVAAVPGENPPPRKDANRPQQVQQVAFRVPSMIGKDYKTAQKMLEQMGLKTKLRPGDPVTKPGQLKYHVYKQQPQPGTPTRRGELIQLILYTDPKSKKN